MDQKEKSEAVAKIGGALGGVALDPMKMSDDLVSQLSLFFDVFEKANVNMAECHLCGKEVPIEEIGSYRAVTGIGHGVASHTAEVSGSCCEGCYPALVKSFRLAAMSPAEREKAVL